MRISDWSSDVCSSDLIRNHLAWAQAGCFPSQQFQMCGCPFVSVDIAVELPVDTRPKHLYRNVPAIRRNRMMNLRNGGSADGSFVKRGKQDFERLDKALFDLKPDTGAEIGRAHV